MKAVVTGAAGFIGSHLCEHLLACGDEVLGIDALTDYYDPGVKLRNLARARRSRRFRFLRADLTDLPLRELLDGADAVFHLAGQPGVRGSWGVQFQTYLERNIRATQTLLEAARAARPARLVYASSSSVYGDAETYPTGEDLCPHPVSPYGVSKLAGEQLCEAYRSSFGLPTVSLRLFTVYGPRQRPDMAFARLFTAAARGLPFPLHGDGEQVRDFTFVADVVRAMRQAALGPWCGVANVGGGCPVTMNQVIALVGELAAPVRLNRLPPQHGDVRRTAADITLARSALGYRPTVDLRTGLTAMAAAWAPATARSPRYAGATP